MTIKDRIWIAAAVVGIAFLIACVGMIFWLATIGAYYLGYMGVIKP